MSRIIIADDHEIVRQGLVQLLKKQPGIEIIGQARDGMEAVELCERLIPDVVVLDIEMPMLNGIEAAEMILKQDRDVRVIILSMHSDDSTVMRALNSGVTGFVLKNSPVRELVDAVRTVTKGQPYLSPKISATVMKNVHTKRTSSKVNKLTTLTPKEKHVLQLIAEGYSTKEIAGMLNVTFHTAKTHRNHVMEKLQLHSAAELTRYAIKNKITRQD